MVKFVTTFSRCRNNETIKEYLLTINPRNIRIEGIYQQRQEDYFMQRVKLAAGVISAQQAELVASVADRFGKGVVHLTSRGSMEVHWLKLEDLPAVKQEFAKVGLTSRGACGGAVRGVTCSSQAAVAFPQLESLAHRLQRHFTGNPRYEGLPKKFKLGLEASTDSGRHLIQDVGLVFCGIVDGIACYDLWIAGGLGREPRAGFLLAGAVRENRIIPMIEAVIAVYARLVPPPKRLKTLAVDPGEDELRRLITAETGFNEDLPLQAGFADNLTPAGKGDRLIIPIFAGQLPAAELRRMAGIAVSQGDGVLQVTADQDLALILPTGTGGQLAPETDAVIFRICPGSHECRMGLTATRDVAMDLLAVMTPAARGKSWAISGCANSCTQPQLADWGIIASKLVSGEDGTKTPRFDLYHRSSAGLGNRVRQQLTLSELLELAEGSVPLPESS